MKILDRYVLSTFLKNYVISFMVLVGMYVVLDMVFNFHRLVDIKGKSADMQGVDTAGIILGILDYYFYQIFLIFVYLSGVIPVVAAAFTLMRLSRFNELTAVLSAGVPMLRVAMPVILAGVVLNGLLIADQELFIPNMIPKLMRDHNDRADADTKSFEIRALQDNNLGLIRVSRYTPGAGEHPPTMEIVDITERRQVDRPVVVNGQEAVVRIYEASAHVTADSATWNEAEKRWDLTNGRRMTGLGADDAISQVEEIAHYQSNVTPEEINLYHSGNWVDFLSTSKIDELIERPGSYGQANLLRVKHARFTQPIMNVILLLLAIPCVLTREPGKLKAAATKCLLLTGAGMAAIFLSHQLAGTPAPRPEWAADWPAFVAWSPVFVFGPLAVFLLDRVKT